MRLPGGETYNRVRKILRRCMLHTVCEEAFCPNVADCWGSGTATIMLLGDVCTRSCRFCAVRSGNPRGAIDTGEPRRVAEAVAELGLRYAVLTSVCRDDLPDGGAAHFAETVRAIKMMNHDTVVEALIPDFNADRKALEELVASGPEVVGHNIETVERLTPFLRDPRAGYRKSLKVLATIKELNHRIFTKSSIMLGLGETEEEVVAAMTDLRSVGVDMLTLGQYLRPSKKQLPVTEYVPPEKFERLKQTASRLGFRCVVAGPLVRSSYLSAEHYAKMLAAGCGK